MIQTASLIDELSERVAGLSPGRRNVLLSELLTLRKPMMLHPPEDPAAAERDDPHQLPLFGFRTLVESDDGLKVITLADIAAVYGIHVGSLLRYVRAGELKATRFGRRYHVTIAELRRFLATPRLKAQQPEAQAKAIRTKRAKAKGTKGARA